MIGKLINRIKLYRSLCFFKYLYLNYFCKQIIRTDNSRILPYKGSILDLAKGAKIYIGGGDIEIGCDKLKGSSSETRIRLREHSIWSCEGGCRIAYDTTVIEELETSSAEEALEPSDIYDDTTANERDY